MENLSLAQRKALATKKIGYQFPKTPEGKLMWAVVRQAIEDLYRPQSECTTALLYLKGPMWHAQSCGVDPDWIRLILRKMKILK